MVTIMSAGISAIIFLIVLSFVNLAGSWNNTQIQNDFAKVGCNYPLYRGADQLNGTIIYPPSQFNFGTYYQCQFCKTCQPQQVGVTASYKNYNATTFNAFPDGWFSYVADTVAVAMFKFSAGIQIIGTVLTPFGFTMLGMGSNDMNVSAQIIVFVLYIVD